MPIRSRNFYRIAKTIDISFVKQYEKKNRLEVVYNWMKCSSNTYGYNFGWKTMKTIILSSNFLKPASHMTKSILSWRFEKSSRCSQQYFETGVSVRKQRKVQVWGFTNKTRPKYYPLIRAQYFDEISTHRRRIGFSEHFSEIALNIINMQIWCSQLSKIHVYSVSTAEKMENKKFRWKIIINR